MTYAQVIEHYGSAIKAAKALGIDRKAVHAWKQKGVPQLRQYQIQALTGSVLVASPPVES
jgi:hypothetical protein